jgi:hypothetical protein
MISPIYLTKLIGFNPSRISGEQHQDTKSRT